MSEPSYDPGAIVAACPAPLLVVDREDRVRFASPAARSLWADDPTGSALGKLLRLDPSGGSAGRFEALLDGGGARRMVDIHAVPLPPGEDRLLVLHDVTEHKRLLARMERLALTDPLTRLANRRGFERALRIEHRRTARAAQPLSLLAVDVDGLKTHNDLHGHAAGDRWLRSVAQALRVAARRPGDLAARVGGDEFAVLLPDTPLDAARSLALRIQAALAEGGTDDSVQASVSIGAACLPAGRVGADARAALRHDADGALYAAKVARARTEQR